MKFLNKHMFIKKQKQIKKYFCLKKLDNNQRFLWNSSNNLFKFSQAFIFILLHNICNDISYQVTHEGFTGITKLPYYLGPDHLFSLSIYNQHYLKDLKKLYLGCKWAQKDCRQLIRPFYFSITFIIESMMRADDQSHM